jgi:ADP-ribosylglycohydrolase
MDYMDSPNPRFLKAGEYTDDTQQVICLSETLLDGNGHFEPMVFLEKLHSAVSSKKRGVGPSTQRVLDAIDSGQQRELLDGRFTSANPSNGGAMRIAPLALLYHRDMVQLRAKVVEVTKVTHSHPRAITGACVQAFLVASRVGRIPETLEPARLRRQLVDFVSPVDLEFAELLAEPIDYGFGNSCWVDDTVPPVVDAFFASPDIYAKGVLDQVNSNGDTDTKASMLGSLLGVHLGFEAIPEQWLNGLENGLKGRDHLLLLADALWLLDRSRVSE